LIIEGTIQWCKLDKPRDNYNKQHKIMDKITGEPAYWGREYSVTFSNLSHEAKLALRDAGVLDRVKDKLDDLGDQMTFRLNEFDKDDEAQCIKVVHEDGSEWDWKEDGLIGNGSVGAMKFNVWRPTQGKARIYPVSMMVLEHVPYDGADSADREDADDWSNYKKAGEEPAAKAKTSNKKAATKTAVEDDLDDDVPF